jgi:hypothetical protein
MQFLALARSALATAAPLARERAANTLTARVFIEHSMGV